VRSVRDGKPVAEGALIDKQGAAQENPAAPRAGIAPESIRGRSTFRLRDTPAPSRARCLQFFTSLLGNQLRARLLASSSRVVSSVLEIVKNRPVGINAALKGHVRDEYRGSQLNKQKINQSKQYVKRTK
jgi:hypothetical protein